jgi:hypothetical protein
MKWILNWCIQTSFTSPSIISSCVYKWLDNILIDSSLGAQAVTVKRSTCNSRQIRLILLPLNPDRYPIDIRYIPELYRIPTSIPWKWSPFTPPRRDGRRCVCEPQHNVVAPSPSFKRPHTISPSLAHDHLAALSASPATTPPQVRVPSRLFFPVLDSISSSRDLLIFLWRLSSRRLQFGLGRRRFSFTFEDFIPCVRFLCCFWSWEVLVEVEASWSWKAWRS